MIKFLDTTLRDGAQNTDVSYSLQDKLDIIRALDALGIAYIEAGAPSYSEIDKQLFANADRPLTSELVAFGSTRKKSISAGKDKALASLVACGAGTISIVGKASARCVRDILETSEANNLNMIADSVALATKCGKKVIFDAEHFFDGYRENPKYALRVLHAAIKAGAQTLVLCDTNGGAFPQDVFTVAKKVVKRFGAHCEIGIHAHNDCGLAVANSLAAVRAGATHVQGTLLGIGERCGNAALATLIPIIKLSLDCAVCPEPKTDRLTHIARTVAEDSNLSIPDNTPFIGGSAFAHKAGMHADGVLKDAPAFEHISPLSVGNTRRLVLSEASGRHLILAKLLPYFPTLTKDSEGLGEIFERVKTLAAEGYTYEGAEGSFVLLADKLINNPKPRFEVSHYSLTTSSDKKLCSATITIKVDDIVNTATACGVGPVHALDIAMRECLIRFYPVLQHTTLTDYKVRVLNPKNATSATVRVLISTSDGKNVWRTIGVSPDIIEASLLALIDSYIFALR